MRITDLTLYSNDVEVVTLSLAKAKARDKFMALTMTGLDPIDLIPKFYGFGLKTKPVYYDFVMKPRDIGIKIALNPRFTFNETYSDVRDELYRLISSARTGLVTIYFMDSGATVAKISGFITKFEVPHFTERPEATMTIRCDNPMFRAINPIVYDSSKLSDTNPIILADNISTAPHGFGFQVTFTATSADFTIQDAASDPEWKFKIIPSGGFQVGDVLHFSSDAIDKHLYFVRGGNTTYLMDRIEPGSIWPVIFPGANEFYFLDIADFDWNTLEFYAAYWGV